MSSANLSVRALPETLRSLAFGSISGTYAGLGSAFANPIRILFIENLTDVTLTYSWDGVNDHLVLPRNGYIAIDVTANLASTGGAFHFAQGTRIYVKGTAASLGATYLTVFYGTGA